MNEQLIEQVKADTSKLDKLSISNLQEVASEASQDVYSRLMELLEGNQEAKDLLSSYNELEFFQYRLGDCDPSDIKAVKEIVRNTWDRVTA